MKDLYLDTVSSIERLHRLFLEVVKNELDRQGIHDMNNVQALILYNLGKSQLTVSELTNRGYYLGSNASYNLRKMIQNGYIDQEVSVHDRRAIVVKLSARGLDFYKKFDAAMNRQVTIFIEKNIPLADLQNATNLLRQMEAFWSEFLIRR
ncbi:MAG: MarR family winged helix-turn-helix transcriptional regulator [Holosporales bacterium]|jgi:DNA-binding MarR family transcriptional regulator|nr:MarR family winged helix-turn-helix transcriptional regulator [Holosporales bacterium]